MVCAPASASPTIRIRWPGRCAPIIRRCSTCCSTRRTRWPFVSRTADGIPLIPDPISATASSRCRARSPSSRCPTSSCAGYIRSWNVAVQKELRWGFVGEAAYVGTRQIDQLGFRELNWSPIGGGQAGRQLNQKFGRTGQTRLIAPIGDSQYDALQTRLRPPVHQRLPVRRQLHLVEVDRDRRQCPTATARCGSTSPSTTT